MYTIYVYNRYTLAIEKTRNQQHRTSICMIMRTELSPRGALSVETSPQPSSYLCITLTCNDTIRNPSYRGCMLSIHAARELVVSSNADASFPVLGFDRLVSSQILVAQVQKCEQTPTFLPHINDFRLKKKCIKELALQRSFYDLSIFLSLNVIKTAVILKY